MKLKTGAQGGGKISKVGSLKRLIKNDKPVVKLTKKKRKTKMNNIRNERGDITTDLMDIERLITENCEQFYAHTLYDLDEVEHCLDIICQNAHKEKETL